VAAARLGYGRQLIDDDDVSAVTRVLRGDLLSCGPAVEAFETSISKVCGAPFAVAVANGTSALRLLYRVAGVGPGKRVGVPAITFAATASQAIALGAEVVLLDVDPNSLLLTPEILERVTTALDYVVPVHIAGLQCDLRRLAEIAQRRGIVLLEDAAHAFGSSGPGAARCGELSFSHGAIFSFHPVKNVTTAEGGAIVVKDAAWAERLRSLRHHGVQRSHFTGPQAAHAAGASWYHEFHEIAGNDRLSDLHAALGVSQIAKLERFKALRSKIHAGYRRALAGLTWLSLPPEPNDQAPCWHLFQVQIDWRALGLSRAELFASAAQAGVQLQVHYIPLQFQPIFASLPRAMVLTGSEQAYRGLVTLPCYPALLPEEQAHVIAWLCQVGSGVCA
jgi:dTDP-4-amino-4,6-dideoxygalactose transaminase